MTWHGPLHAELNLPPSKSECQNHEVASAWGEGLSAQQDQGSGVNLAWKPEEWECSWTCGHCSWALSRSEFGNALSPALSFSGLSENCCSWDRALCHAVAARVSACLPGMLECMGLQRMFPLVTF